MGKNTAIEWCNRILPDGTIILGHSFNVWWGCVRVARECDGCYADDLATRYGMNLWGPFAERRFFGEKHWNEPYIWDKEAERLGHRANVFCSSMADVFEVYTIRRNQGTEIQKRDERIAAQMEADRKRLWKRIEQTRNLNWILLTKRPGNVEKLVPWGNDWPDNVWLGTSAGTQERADKWLPILLKIPAQVHLVSVEPQLEHVDLSPYLPRLDWVIQGGESGPHHRPFKAEWARSLRDQCMSARLQGYPVAYYFKQWGGRLHNSGGRMLDGRTHDDMPPEYPVQRKEVYV